jgi:selenocysteine-specific elongation factor
LVEGDRFIIRSPEETLGGGRVIESHVRRHRRFTPKVIKSIKDRAQGSTEEVVLAILEAKEPLEYRVLLAQGNLPTAQLGAVVDSLTEQGKIIAIGWDEDRLLLTSAGWEHMFNEVVGNLKKYHQKFPSRMGMPRAELYSRLKMGSHRKVVLQKLVDESVIVEEGAQVRLTEHQVQLTPAQQKSLEIFLASLGEHPYAPPANLIPEPDLLNLLIVRDQVVKIAGDVVFSTPAYNEMVAGITSHLKTKGRVTVAEVRDMFHTSRKYAVALLEYLDGIKVTRRVGDERVLC